MSSRSRRYAIEWVREITLGRREAYWSTKDSVYYRFFMVKTSHKGVEEEAVRTANGIPLIGDPHPKNSSSLCIRIHAKQREHTNILWDVQVDYGIEEVPLEEGEDLSSLAPVVRFRSDGYSRPLAKGYDPLGTDTLGHPSVDVLNSAQEPFENPPETEEVLGTILIEDYKLASEVNPTTLMLYKNVVNSEHITVGGVGIPAGNGKIADIALDPEKDKDGVRFFKRSFTLSLNPRGHRFELRDRGYSYFPGGYLDENLDPLPNPNPRVSNVDADGTPVATDLNGKGDKREEGGDVEYLTYYGYFEADWDNATLDFPEDAFPEKETEEEE